MSETAGTVIKLLAALTSPKACVKYITVAFSLYLAWVFLKAPLDSVQVSLEQKSIILLLSGVGFGSLLGHGLSAIIDNAWQKHITSRNEKKEKELKEIEDKKDQEDQLVKNKKLVDRFISSFKHLTVDQKDLLRELTNDNKNINIDNGENAALIKNDYVNLLLNVQYKTYLVEISPLIKEFVINQWQEELKLRVNEIVESTQGQGLLNILKNKDDEFPIDSNLFDGLSRYSGAIRGEADAEQNGFWIWFDKYILDTTSELTGHNYVDELFIPESRIENKA